MKSTLCITILSLFFIYCSNDDITQRVSEHPIAGQWTLISYEPGFSPVSNYNPGDISWDISDENRINVTIAEGVTVNRSMPLSATGEYLFTINNGNIIINEEEFQFNINNATLTINANVAADGKRLIFSKVSK